MQRPRFTTLCPGLRRFALLAFVLTAPLFALPAQDSAASVASGSSVNSLRISKVGQAAQDDIDRAALAFDDALRQALREAALTLVLPGQDEKLDAFLVGLTREHLHLYCTQAEPTGRATAAGSRFQQQSTFTLRADVLNRRLALAAVPVKSTLGLLPPPRLFLALQDKWNSSGEKSETWIIDRETPSRQQVAATLRKRHPDFPITEDNTYSNDGENRDALLVKARNAGTRLLLMGRMRSHQVLSAAATSNSSENASLRGLTANQNSDPLKKADRIQLVISRPRILVGLEWQIFDVASGALLHTIRAQRDPMPNDPSELTDALRAAKTALVNERIDDLWMALITWNQKSAE